MTDFPWLYWVLSTIAFEVFLVWYIRRAQATGSIENHNWPFKSERLMERSEDPPKFDRLIRGWWMLTPVVPFITFGLLYFGDY
jgi:hypothetical protein